MGLGTLTHNRKPKGCLVSHCSWIHPVSSVSRMYNECIVLNLYSLILRQCFCHELLHSHLSGEHGLNRMFYDCFISLLLHLKTLFQSISSKDQFITFTPLWILYSVYKFKNPLLKPRLKLLCTEYVMFWGWLRTVEMESRNLHGFPKLSPEKIFPFKKEWSCF